VAAASGARLVQVAVPTRPALAAAVLAVLPLDDFGPAAAWTDAESSATVRRCRRPVATSSALCVRPASAQAVPLERFAFYEGAESAFAILRSGEQRRYGNLLLRKGVVDAA